MSYSLSALTRSRSIHPASIMGSADKQLDIVIRIRLPSPNLFRQVKLNIITR